MDLWNVDIPKEVVTINKPDSKPVESRKKYLILAGINKYERQLYLTGYKDCEDWVISIVPKPTSKSKANTLIKKAEKELVDLRKRFPRRYPEDIKFEIKEYIDPFENDIK